MSCLSKGLLRSSALLSILLALTAGPIGLPEKAFALSELKPAQKGESEPQAQNGEQPQQAQPAEPDEVEGDSDGIPLPDPLVDRSAGKANQQSAKPDTTPEMSVADAASLMMSHAIGGLPVVDADGAVIGVITESDIFKAFVRMHSAESQGMNADAA